MTLHPLPLRTKIYHGETVSSYAHRAARCNHTSMREVELELRSRGVLASRARSNHARADAWRTLGQLHHSAFLTPTTQGDDPIHERRLCLRCSHGQPATGRLPEAGLVCLRHRRWLGRSQFDLRHYRPAMTAERRFRALHAQRGLLYDREPMHISMEAAALALGAELATRLERTAFPDSHALLYREQISMAQVLTSRHFLDIACDPRIPAPTRRAFVDRQIHMTLAVSPDHPNAWRASGRIWIVVRSLADEVRDAGFSRRTPSDNQFNLLRHSSFTAHAETNDAVSDHHPRGPR